MSLKTNQISIKATTTDHLGFIGSKQGVAAMSIVLIEKNNYTSYLEIGYGNGYTFHKINLDTIETASNIFIFLPL